ncbi:16S rRNA (guanine(527)-N(7))-methyltransferase RsmG [Haliovirga abyssi]|uniref:Ribosomal RNA small subunit methyltransferase G n=1 Tax=Haliovirga abyssi TaxID=2996794 RepID=A0AAU9D2U7_9FUSO|nr:16S rRNA (guanine(527)-N(7))-methyltransferase RsmG [Haliovirga abyssi]BDU50306.1 ribosomal RNA small subunit methyltransferase G [Haliovirga abyssi]
MKKILEKGLGIINLKLDEKTMDKLCVYGEFLQKKNKIVNLTSIIDDEGIIEKHFIDSLLLQKYLENYEGVEIKNVIDVGTGAGFPGMVLAIVNPNINFTLIDSIGKKVEFLKELKEKLGIENVNIYKTRAEDFIKENREKFDIGVCRAVSELRVILEYIIPFLKVGGSFLAQKVNYEQELEEAKNALELLNGEVIKIDKMRLPFNGENRVVLNIKKTKTTDKRYPRRAGIPVKRPL